MGKTGPAIATLKSNVRSCSELVAGNKQLLAAKREENDDLDDLEQQLKEPSALTVCRCCAALSFFFLFF